MRRADRQAAAHLAAAQGAQAIFLECVCPSEVTLDRLARRWAARVNGDLQAGGDASQASDGRPDLYAAQQTQWEAFSAAQEPGLTHFQIETKQGPAVSMEQAWKALDIPHFACWNAPMPG
jgi:predicted kinase